MPVKRGKSKKKKAGKKKPVKNRTKKSSVRTSAGKGSRKPRNGRKEKPVAATVEKKPNEDSNDISPVESIFEMTSDKDYLPLNPEPMADVFGNAPDTGKQVLNQDMMPNQILLLNPAPTEDTSGKITNPEPYPKNINSSAPSMYCMILILISLI